MYNKILVPVDISHEERLPVMLEAAKLLGGGNAKVLLTNVVEDIPTYVTAQIPSEMLEDAQKNVIDHLKKLASEQEIDAEIIVKTGHPGNTILEIAEEKDVDVIVVASHKPGWEDYLLGSTAARVVRHAKCAVHVLR